MFTVDASVLINASEPAEQDHAASRRLLALAHRQRTPLIQPMLALVEVAGMVTRLRDSSRSARLVALTRRLSGVSFVALDEPMTALAIHLAQTYRLRRADAVYAAVALQSGTTLVSRDREHLTRLPSVIMVVTPTDALTLLGA